MKDIITGVGFKLKAAAAAGLAALAISCGPELEVRTFELSRLDASEAQALIEPYVFRDRQGAPGSTGQMDGVLTVREMPENLDRIETVLERYDQDAADIQLHFQVIEANGFTEQDDAITELTAELRGLLKYEGYRLVGEAVIQTREGGGHAEQRVHPAITPENVGVGGAAAFKVVAGVGRVTRSDGETSVLLEVGLSDPWDRLLSTTLTVTDGKTMVLGTTAGQPNREGRAAALILVVTPTIS